MVPILLALLACGFGILANFHPKMEMAREPKGNFGEMLDKVSLRWWYILEYHQSKIKKLINVHIENIVILSSNLGVP